MKKTQKFAAVTAVVVMAMTSSAFAETRHRNQTNDGWRGDNRRGDDRRGDDRRGDDRRGDDRRGYGDYGHNDRDFVRGVVERVDYRRGTILLREQRSNRRVSVVMVGGNRNRRGVDLSDLRRGDYVTLAGDWHRRGVFEAYRIESVRDGRR